MKTTPSPYFDSSNPANEFKANLLSHLDLLLLPTPKRHSKQACNQECHILERNHLVDVVKQFIREN